jgi:hypothetical protein
MKYDITRTDITAEIANYILTNRSQRKREDRKVLSLFKHLPLSII